MVTVCAEPGRSIVHAILKPRTCGGCSMNIFDSFQQVYDERFQEKYGYWRPIVEQSVAAFLKCGDLQEGFARVRCPDVSVHQYNC